MRLVTLADIVTLEQLSTLWPAFDKEGVCRILFDEKIKTYKLQKILQGPSMDDRAVDNHEFFIEVGLPYVQSGNRYVCEHYHINYNECNTETILENLEQVVFDYEDITKIDSNNSYFLENSTVAHKELHMMFAEHNLLKSIKQNTLESNVHVVQTNCVGSEFKVEKQKSQQNAGKQKYQPRGQITQKDAAKLCGVSLRTFQDWEYGKKESPIPNMPCRTSAFAFRKWSISLNEDKKSKDAARGISRAITMPTSQIDEHDNVSAWDENEDNPESYKNGGKRKTLPKSSDEDDCEY